MLGVFVVERMLGGIGVCRAPIDPLPLTGYVLAEAPLAFIEEYLARSLLLSGLMAVVGGRNTLAVVVSAVIFGLAHAANPSASPLSVLGNALGGLTYGFAFVWTRRIWFPFGLHLAWNVVQGPILGFPVSGHAMGGLNHIKDIGPLWVTGGAYGPETGLVGILSRPVILVPR